MRYKEFTLDDFQIDAINSVEKGNSCIVSAATGTGKTLIADYIINKHIGSEHRIVYTAPIKALSNQKFREFKAEYGEDKIGLLTGDVTINPEAQVLIMTTEIYRNMLMARDVIVNRIKYVILDEIHFINDVERGTIWEETIIFSPPHIRFLCLSATIPNAHEFAQWIKKIKNHEVDVVVYEKRAVPLNHMLFDSALGLCTEKELTKEVELDRYPSYEKHRGFRHQKLTRRPEPYELVKHLHENEMLPCIYFVFSRKECQRKAQELERKVDYLEDKKESILYFNSKITDTIRPLESTNVLKRLIAKGIGFHHAGLLPVHKEIVENLFNKGLIKVLFATETFAVGINMPAKTVCFNTMDKFDGINFRSLRTKEYFQMAGRAGRRGIDTVGYSIVVVDRRSIDLREYERVSSKDIEPIESQFKLSYNTVLNLIRNHTPDEIDIILKSNFAYFKKPYNVKGIFESLKSRLAKQGYIENGALSEKGEIAAKLYTQELILSEFIWKGLYKELTSEQMNVFAAAVAYERRREDRFDVQHANIKPIMDAISKSKMISKRFEKRDFVRMYNLVMNWSMGSKFESLLKITNLLEGDIIRLFRQIIDVLRQMKKAYDDESFRRYIEMCIGKIDRDIIKVQF